MDMVDIRQVSGRFAVAPQISPADFSAIYAQGYRHIINNRPDGEERDQPTSQEIEAAARKEGMTYVHVPFVGRPTADAVKAVMAASPKTLAFCRSGTRSVTAWAMAQASDGGGLQETIEAAQEVGYNLGSMRGLLRQLGAR
jgi:uncharacterized protein (TIGR01244 family)